MLIKNYLIVLLLYCSVLVSAQTNYDVQLGRDNVAITQVKLTFNGSSYSQSSGNSVSTQTALPVNLDEVTINDGGTSKVLDQFNFYGSAIRNNNFTSNVRGVAVYDEGTITSADNASAFESAMDGVTGGTNLLAYLYYDGTSNLPSGDDFDMLWSYGLTNDDYLVVAERNGNTHFTVTPLDSVGNPITTARKLRFGHVNGTNSANGNRLYDWNLGYRPSNQNQPMYMTVVDVSLFNANISIHGIRIDNNGQADVKFFGVSDDTFSDNPTTTVIGNITGNVYEDSDGTLDNHIDGLPIGVASGTQLYVSALSTSGTVVRTVAVDADGTYELLNLPSATYNLVVHTTSSGSSTSVAPSGWYHTGENLGNGLGHDGAINGTIDSVAVNDSTVRFANFGIFTSPLSVKWKEVSVQKLDKDGNKIEWVTTSEENSAYFKIERSNNREEWQYIGEIEAAGFSSEEVAYEYYDTEVPNFTVSELFYRIKQIDLNGTETYSDIVYIQNDNRFDLSLFPNPIRDRAILRVGGVVLSSENVQLSTVEGVDLNYALESVEDGGISIDAKSLRAGVYLVRVRHRGAEQVKRIIIQ